MTASPITPSQGSRRFDALDGFRGVFLMFVVVGHLGATQIWGSWIFLSGFFSISGYLIATMLLREHDRTGTINVVGFLRRRARRLLPALFALMVVVGTWAVFMGTDTVRRQMKNDILATTGFVMNWRLVHQQDQYFAQFAEVSFFRHAWTLAIEEQFYILSPLIILGLLAMRSSRMRVGLLVVVILASTWWAAHIGTDSFAAQARVYYGTDTRLSAIVVGVLLAFLLRNGIRWRHSTLAFIGVFSFVVSVILAFVVEPMSALMFDHGGLLAFVVLWTAGLVTLVDDGPSRYRDFLSNRVLVWLGVRIYGIYLWHWPIALWLGIYATGLPPWLHVVLGVALTLTIAGLSFRYLELPIMRGGVRALVRRIQPIRVVVASVTGVVLLAFGVGAVPAVDLQDAASVPALISTDGPYEASEDHRRFVLFGDSVPHYYVEEYPAELYSDVELTSLAVPGCGLLPWGVRWSSSVVEPVKPDCKEAYDALSDDLSSMAFDGFVLMSGSVLSVPHVTDAGNQVDLQDQEFQAQLVESLDSIKEKVEAADVPFVGVVTVPCRDDDRKALNVIDETVADEALVQDEFIRRLADPFETNALLTDWASKNGISVIDLYGALDCAEGYRPQIRGVRLFRDFFHFSLEGAAMVSTWLIPQIRAKFESLSR